MSVNEYKLPDVGEGLTEAEIVGWKVKVGDTIKVNDIVVEIETAKSLVELPSPYAGTITALLVPEGETVAVGTPIISVSSGDPAGAPGAAAPGAAASAVDAGAATSEPVEEPMKTLVGYGPRATEAKRRPRRGGATAASEAGAAAQMQLQSAFVPGGAESADVADADEQAVPTAPVHDARADDGDGAPAKVAPVKVAPVKVLAKPPVRKLAKDLGVDLRSVRPSGPHGTITRADIEGHASAAASSVGSAAVGSAAVGSAAVGSAAVADVSVGGAAVQRPGEREHREPIKGVRKMMAQAMVDSAFTAPHVTEWITVDVTKTMRYVERLKVHRDFRDVKVSPLLVVAKAVCLAVRRTPEVNAAWDEAAQEVVYKSYVNLGIAAATPRGLVVPNVKDADRMSAPELAAAINALTSTAREGKTQPAQMSGGSFTITNVGVFGVDAGTPIINPGESAILCFGAVRKQPWVRRGKIRARDVTTLALSFDHRLVDGEKGSRFLADVAGILEDPASALLF